MPPRRLQKRLCGFLLKTHYTTNKYTFFQIWLYPGMKIIWYHYYYCCTYTHTYNIKCSNNSADIRSNISAMLQNNCQVLEKNSYNAMIASPSAPPELSHYALPLSLLPLLLNGDHFHSILEFHYIVAAAACFKETSRRYSLSFWV